MFRSVYQLSSLLSACIVMLTLSSCAQTQSYQIGDSIWRTKMSSEKILNAKGSWNLIEQGRALDPAQAHMNARKKVNVHSHKTRKDLAAHFEPNAKSGQDGKLRVLRLDPGKAGWGAIPQEYEAAESAVVKPSRAIAREGVVKKLSAIFKTEAVEQAVEHANVITPARKPMRSKTAQEHPQAAQITKRLPAASTKVASTKHVGSSAGNRVIGDIVLPPRLPARKTMQQQNIARTQTPVPASKPTIPFIDKPSLRPAPKNPKQRMSNQIASASRAKVINLRSGSHPNKIRIVLELTNNTKYNAAIDHRRNVLRIRLSQARWDMSASGRIRENAILSGYKAQEQADGSVVLEIDLKKKAKIIDTMILKPSTVSSHHRVVIDVRGL